LQINHRSWKSPGAPPPGLFFGVMPLRLLPVSVTPEASHLEGRCHRIIIIIITRRRVSAIVMLAPTTKGKFLLLVCCF
jgi:hypothetical protein